MKLAETIRQYVREQMVVPCRNAGVTGFSVRAGDVHGAMGLTARLPAVCAGLRSRKFQQENGLELLQIEGPYTGANTIFHFRFHRTTKPPQTDATAPEVSAHKPHNRTESQTSRQIVDRLFLVACVSGKHDKPAPARDLYTSSWFRKARAYVEKTGAPWFILSAEYGLLHPDQVVAPYERTLNRMSAQERQDWARRVREQMDELLPDAGEAVIIAGERYRALLIDYLRTRAGRVSVPMEGMRIGEQLKWLGPGGADQDRSLSSMDQPCDAEDESFTLIADRLLNLDGQIDREVFFPTLEEGAAEFVLRDAYAFLFSICLDRGTRSEIIWTIPWWLSRQWGHFDPARVRAMSRPELVEGLAAMPRRPRYLSDAPRTIEALTRIVVDEYGGYARALWYGRRPVEFRQTLERVHGVGPGIASMAIQLVDRAFPGEMEESATEDLDIKADVHTRRVLFRLGVSCAETDAAAVAAARGLYPAHPGAVDGPLWYIGRFWCHPGTPDCQKCFMADICVRRNVG